MEDSAAEEIAQCELAHQQWLESEHCMAYINQWLREICQTNTTEED
jgi:hypothetical protein